MMGTEIFQFGPGKAEKIGFKDVNLKYRVIVIMDFSKKVRPLYVLELGTKFQCSLESQGHLNFKTTTTFEYSKMKVFWPFKHEPNFLWDIMYIKGGFGDD